MTLHLGKRYIIRTIDFERARVAFSEIRIAEISGGFVRIEYPGGSWAWVVPDNLDVQHCIDCEEEA